MSDWSVASSSSSSSSSALSFSLDCLHPSPLSLVGRAIDSPTSAITLVEEERDCDIVLSFFWAGTVSNSPRETLSRYDTSMTTTLEGEGPGRGSKYPKYFADVNANVLMVDLFVGLSWKDRK